MMPWKIEKRDDEFCVIKESDGSSAGCHATREKALAQQRALYASEASTMRDEEFCGEGMHAPMKNPTRFNDYDASEAIEFLEGVIHHLKTALDTAGDEGTRYHILESIFMLKGKIAEKEAKAHEAEESEAPKYDDYIKDNGHDMYAIDQLVASGAEEFAWEGPIVFEGVKTGDNRVFKPGAIQWDEATLPWAFRWQRSSIKGHEGAVPIGRVDKLERREDGAIYGYGVIIPSLNEEAAEYLRLIQAGVASGVSVDGDSAEFDVQEMDGGQQQVVFSSMRLRSLTAVDIPAFNKARVALMADGECDECDENSFDAEVDEFAAAGWEIVNWGGATPYCLKPKMLGDAGEGNAPELKAPLRCFKTEAEAKAAIASAGDAAKEAKKVEPGEEQIAKAEAKASVEDAEELGGKPNPGTDPDKRLKENMDHGHSHDDEDEDEDEFAKKKRKKKSLKIGNNVHRWTYDAISAAAIPVQPKTEWFVDPQFDSPTPITVSPEGHVYGHLALFNTCHIGFPGACVRPPKGSEYRYFHTGEVETQEGDLVEVGHLTFNTGHAGMTVSPREAAAHYDHTGTVAADVRCGEDEFGIWVSGALRPHLTDTDIRSFRAAPLSGDWRRIAGKMELVGALAVNVPGFPVPRAKVLVASGETETLFTFEESELEAYSEFETRLRTVKRIEMASKVAKDEEEFHTFLDSVDDLNAIEEFFNQCHDQNGRFCGGGGKGGTSSRVPSPTGYVDQRVKTAISTHQGRVKSDQVKKYTTGIIRRGLSTTTAYGAAKPLKLSKANLKDFSNSDLKTISKQLKSDNRRWNLYENVNLIQAPFLLAAAVGQSAATGNPAAAVSSALTSLAIPLGYGRYKTNIGKQQITRIDRELKKRNSKFDVSGTELVDSLEEFQSEDRVLSLAEEIAKAKKELQPIADKALRGELKTGKAPKIPEEVKSFVEALEVDKEDGLTSNILNDIKSVISSK